MATLTFEQLQFHEDHKENNHIKVDFLRNFYFLIPKEELAAISEFEIKKHSISFKSIPEKKAQKKFNSLLAKHMQNLKNKLYNKPTIYIHQNSNIPLIGSSYFGLIDRNTNIIELRPITGCNLNCIYCSVDEGRNTRKQVDFVVEKDYLIQEFKKLIKFKNHDNIEAHIGTQGEPLLYEPMLDLIKDISKIKQVKTISIDTNAVLLNKDMIDKLTNAGLTRLNISLNSINPELANKIAGTKINIDAIKNSIKYSATKLDLIIAPILLRGINEDEIENIIKFVKTLSKENNKHNITMGIQNFLRYKGGRNPTKEIPMEDFLKKLAQLEKKHDVKLILKQADFKIEKTKHLPKPFKRGDIIKAKIVCPGRQKSEMLATYSERTISIIQCRTTSNQSIKVRIIRDKHNIFVAEQV